MRIKSYYNDAIIGNRRMVASFSKKGELLRLNYPAIDYKQFIDFFYVGVKINDSNIIYLHDDINNKYKQYYTENTNILNTEIQNTYFNFKIKQTDFIPMSKNILIKKYEFENNHNIDLKTNFLVYSKLLTNQNNMVGAKVEDDIMCQYTHDYKVSIFSKNKLLDHQLNDVEANIEKGVISDKDYIGMSPASSVSYDLGVIKPKEKVEIVIFVHINENQKEEKDISQYKEIQVNKEISNTQRYWKKYVDEHKIKINKNINNYEKINKIYTRTILLFPLLSNKENGGISAAMEVDENLTKCGRYSYCWPRDAVFITKALDILKMENEAERFYKVFCKKTQSENGMWEQRFYTDCKLAPCWGYQVDETASVVYGVYQHYKYCKKIGFLRSCLKMCEGAISYLEKYIDNIFEGKQIQESYDLWEMNEGIHLYSLSSIYSAFDCMKEIYMELQRKIKYNVKNTSIEKLEAYKVKTKKYIDMNLYTNRALTRNTRDSLVDISTIGAIVPFNVYSSKDRIVRNMIEKINLTLRTHTGGYLRFEKDHYMGGKNPWVISNLWMALYYLEDGKKRLAKECFDFVVNTSNEYGFLAEQINNETLEPMWVNGLGWSHAMFVIALEKILKK